MANSFTFQAMFRPARLRSAEREMAGRPPIPEPKTERPAAPGSRPPVSSFVGEALWAITLMLLLALSVRVMLVFVALQAAPATVHVDETTAAAQPGRAGEEQGRARAQASSGAASRTM